MNFQSSIVKYMVVLVIKFSELVFQMILFSVLSEKNSFAYRYTETRSAHAISLPENKGRNQETLFLLISMHEIIN